MISSPSLITQRRVFVIAHDSNLTRGQPLTKSLTRDSPTLSRNANDQVEYGVIRRGFPSRRTGKVASEAEAEKGSPQSWEQGSTLRPSGYRAGRSTTELSQHHYEDMRHVADLPEKTPTLRRGAARCGLATCTPCTSSGVGVNSATFLSGGGATQPAFTGSTIHFAHTSITRERGHGSPPRISHGNGRSHQGPVSEWRSSPDVRRHAATSARMPTPVAMVELTDWSHLALPAARPSPHLSPVGRKLAFAISFHTRRSRIAVE